MNHKHQGIVHIIGPEHGITQPGMTIVCGDSHTATHGAFGALAFGSDSQLKLKPFKNTHTLPNLFIVLDIYMYRCLY